MQNNQKAPSARRIDLSKCKLLSTYGRNPADSTGDSHIMIGPLTKPGIVKVGLVKTGLIKPN
jgi:hypothetical protein